MNIFNQKYILASGSPRRAVLLNQLGLSFEVIVSDVEEIVPDQIPVEQSAEYLAELKGKHVLKNIDIENKILIAADTIVVLNNKILGKPSSKEQASNFLKELSGKQHKVISGVYIHSNSKEISFSSETLVEFNSLDEDEIQYYISNYEVLDKAGAYAIQEWIGLSSIRSIHGDYFNVVGLPVSKLYQHLKEF